MRARPRLHSVLRLAERLLAIVGALFVVYHLCFDVSVVISPSMSPTLQGTAEDNGDWVLTEKLSYRWRDPRRWEVVTLRLDGMQIMKRVVGLPGETVALREGRPVVADVSVPPPHGLDFLHYYAYGNLREGAAATCGDGWFVLGDHSADSDDSRFLGPISRPRIVGRAWLVLWPPARFGFAGLP